MVSFSKIAPRMSLIFVLLILTRVSLFQVSSILRNLFDDLDKGMLQLCLLEVLSLNIALNECSWEDELSVNFAELLVLSSLMTPRACL